MSARARAASPVLLLLLLLVSAVAPAAAASRLVLPRPVELGTFPASAYDEDGRRIGRAELVLEELDGGAVRARIETSLDRGGRMQASAELEPVAGGLRLLHETAQSFDAEGAAFPLLHVDHVARVATCTPAPGSGARFRRIDLPEDERIVNVPLNLFFLPLVFGRAEELAFQIFICGQGGHVLDFVARARSVAGAGGTDVVEVSYRPDLGAFSWLVSPVLPQLAFWFDKERSGRYLAHRIPLHPGGPEVLVAREGVALASLVER